MGQGSISAPTFTVNDGLNGGNYQSCGTYTLSGSVGAIQSFYMRNTVGGSATVKVTPSVNSALSITVSEYSGLDISSPLGNVHTGSGASGSPTSGTVTISAANELLAGGAGLVIGSDTLAAGAGFNDRENLGGSLTLLSIDAEDKLVSANTAATWTQSGALAWVAVAEEWKLAAAAPSPPPFVPAPRVVMPEPLHEDW